MPPMYNASPLFVRILGKIVRYWHSTIFTFVIQCPLLLMEYILSKIIQAKKTDLLLLKISVGDACLRSKPSRPERCLREAQSIGRASAFP